ncbi:MAG: lipid-transfer protein [Sphingomonadaceae bacterium]|nr:lipid-transfer protein [Sphingomonadaceae bacterium]
MSDPGQTAISGIGQTLFSKESGRTVMSLCAEASAAAIVDAGLEPGDIDGLISFSMDTNSDHDLQQALGIPAVRFTSRLPFGGEGAYATFQVAAAAIESGQANNVLVFRAFNERSEYRFGQPNFDPTKIPRDIHRSQGLMTPAQIYALWHKPYLDHYGYTNEDLGHCVVQTRAWAANNPNSWFYGRPLSFEDHQRSRWIVKPVLRLYDCCQESDGGMAFIVSRLDRARELAQASGGPVVRILGVQQYWPVHGSMMYNYYKPDLVSQDDTEEVARALWEQTGVTAKDIDVSTIYDNFASSIPMSMEGFGLCKPGEAKDLFRSGAIGPGGDVPVNTNGGLIGEAYLHGLNNTLECVRQMRGESPNQIADAQLALCAGRQCGMVLARE